MTAYFNILITDGTFWLSLLKNVGHIAIKQFHSHTVVKMSLITKSKKCTKYKCM